MGKPKAVNRTLNQYKAEKYQKNMSINRNSLIPPNKFHKIKSSKSSLMCLFFRNIASQKVLSIFFIMAFILLFPFFIVSLVLAYERSDDYCLSFGGVKDTGIHGVTLRHWLQVDGFTRLVFFVFAVFLFLAKGYLRDHCALVTVQSNIFRIYYFFLWSWMIFGAVLFWGNVQRAIIFKEIPTIHSYQKNFQLNLTDLSNYNDLDLANYPRIHGISQLQYVARRNSENYYDYHRFDKGPWFHQELVSDWNATGEEAYDRYMRQYTFTEDYYPLTGWRYGCKGRVSAYMWILLLTHLVALPIALTLLGIRSNRSGSDYKCQHQNNVAPSIENKNVPRPPLVFSDPPAIK